MRRRPPSGPLTTTYAARDGSGREESRAIGDGQRRWRAPHGRDGGRARAAARTVRRGVRRTRGPLPHQRGRSGAVGRRPACRPRQRGRRGAVWVGARRRGAVWVGAGRCGAGWPTARCGRTEAGLSAAPAGGGAVWVCRAVRCGLVLLARCGRAGSVAGRASAGGAVRVGAGRCGVAIGRASVCRPRQRGRRGAVGAVASRQASTGVGVPAGCGWRSTARRRVTAPAGCVGRADPGVRWCLTARRERWDAVGSADALARRACAGPGVLAREPSANAARQSRGEEMAAAHPLPPRVPAVPRDGRRTCVADSEWVRRGVRDTIFAPRPPNFFLTRRTGVARTALMQAGRGIPCFIKHSRQSKPDALILALPRHSGLQWMPCRLFA